MTDAYVFKHVSRNLYYSSKGTSWGPLETATVYNRKQLAQKVSNDNWRVADSFLGVNIKNIAVVQVKTSVTELQTWTGFKERKDIRAFDKPKKEKAEQPKEAAPVSGLVEPEEIDASEVTL